MENQEQSKPEPQNNDQDIVPITLPGDPWDNFEYLILSQKSSGFSKW